MEQDSMAIGYSEVYSLLNILGQKYINSIPKKLYNVIENKRAKSYNPTYDLSIPLYKQKISKKGTALICLLHYNYWCESEEEKNKINQILKYNTSKAREKSFEYEKKFNNKNVSIRKEKVYEDNSKRNINNTETAIIKKENIFIRIWNFFKKIFTK